jgi:hypothetical protein
MTAGLSSPKGLNIDAVIASTLWFVLTVEFVVPSGSVMPGMELKKFNMLLW